MVPRIRYRVTLTEKERNHLSDLTTKGRHASQTVLNALILLGCDEGPSQENRLTAEQLAEVLPVSTRKVDRTKKRFVEEGLDAALQKRKPDRVYERKVDGDVEAHLVALSCSEPPTGHARWSLRLLADKMVELEYVDGISHETVRRTLKKTRSNRGAGNSG
jgi:hypothetical protein